MLDISPNKFATGTLQVLVEDLSGHSNRFICNVKGMAMAAATKQRNNANFFSLTKLFWFEK